MVVKVLDTLVTEFTVLGSPAPERKLQASYIHTSEDYYISWRAEPTLSQGTESMRPLMEEIGAQSTLC